jgi:NADPH:quinone reductase-like Zn-dependent oxidoreductase
VFDTIAGEYIDRSLEVIKKGGMLISIPSGLNETVKEKAQAKGIDGKFTLVESNGEDMKAIADLLAQGIIKSKIHNVFAFENLKDAHTQVESGRTVGKVIVTL